MKKTIALLLALSLCVGLCLVGAKEAPEGIWTDHAATGFDGGSGTAEDPYRIATPEQLALLAANIQRRNPNDSYAGKSFLLVNDLDLSAHRWIPIGGGAQANGGSGYAFHGDFDGNGKTIRGLYVDESGRKFSAGLFGFYTGGVIKNLMVEDAYVKTEGEYDEDYYGYPEAAGILIGDGTQGYGLTTLVENCHVSGTVETNTVQAGGLVGYSSYSVFRNCSVQVQIKGSTFAGGFVGSDWEGTYENCTAKGSVEGFYSVGGFAGQFFCTKLADHCLTEASVTATGSHTGGFVGYLEYLDGVLDEPTRLTACVALGQVENQRQEDSTRTGGFAGTAGAAVLEKCHTASPVTTLIPRPDATGGFFGYWFGGEATGCSFDKEKNSDLSAIGVANAQEEASVEAGSSMAVLAHICEDYYEGHEWDPELTIDQAATCEGEGLQSVHCLRCGSSSGEYLPIAPIGHDYGAWAVEKAPTATEAGVEVRSCNHCQKRQEREIPPTGGIPNTGDSIALAALCLALSAAAGAGLWIGKKKEQ